MDQGPGLKPIDMRRIREVVRLHEDRKASVRQIARACQIGRSAVDEYPHRAKATGLSRPLPGEMSDAELESRLFPPRPQPGEPPRPLPDWSTVHQELGRQDVTRPPFEVYSLIRRFHREDNDPA